MNEQNRKIIQEIRNFNRFYTNYMGLLNLGYLGSKYSAAEARILFELKLRRACTQSDIAKTLHIDKSYLSRIIRRLCAEGVIERVRSQADQRAVTLSLTEKGNGEAEELIGKTELRIDGQLVGLSAEECDRLCNALNTVVSILKRGETEMKVIPFEERYRQDFIDFNTDWIVSNFGAVEAHDLETFETIDEKLQAGAMIFFAVQDGIALAACMATPMEGTTWEICKLCSNRQVPHKGAGSAVFQTSMEWALSHGAERLFILSNRKLKPALHIYRKFGFQEIKLQSYEYARGEIAFEYLKR